MSLSAVTPTKNPLAAIVSVAGTWNQLDNSCPINPPKKTAHETPTTNRTSHRLMHFSGDNINRARLPKKPLTNNTTTSLGSSIINTAEKRQCCHSVALVHRLAGRGNTSPVAPNRFFAWRFRIDPAGYTSGGVESSGRRREALSDSPETMSPSSRRDAN